MTPVVSTPDPAFVDAFRAGTSTQAPAEAAMPRDHLAATFFLLQLGAAMACVRRTRRRCPHPPPAPSRPTPSSPR